MRVDKVTTEGDELTPPGSSKDRRVRAVLAKLTSKMEFLRTRSRAAKATSPYICEQARGLAENLRSFCNYYSNIKINATQNKRDKKFWESVGKESLDWIQEQSQHPPMQLKEDCEEVQDLLQVLLET